MSHQIHAISQLIFRLRKCRSGPGDFQEGVLFLRAWKVNIWNKIWQLHIYNNFSKLIQIKFWNIFEKSKNDTSVEIEILSLDDLQMDQIVRY